ncbi:MAG: acyl-ACP--UDP-N-acetylglucosamine O-acyltransferase [Chthoniobacterales bacterium]|nr:acyl-ACP--UDP-N-acetylglucosamine O-acyltransferase [Chthoniobacterales bacterium]
MPAIDPTAIVSAQAHLADDVVVGPGVIVEAGAIIGPGCRLLARSIITGCVQMGSNNEVGYGAILGGDPQVLNSGFTKKGAVVIGNENIFREYVTIHRASKEGEYTIIGDNNFLMVGVHIGHNSSIDNHVIIANNCLIAGHVQIHDKANLGGGAVFHQGISIGTLAMVRGGSRMSKNIPPYLIAYESDEVSSLNVVGLRRSGMSNNTRNEIKRAFKLLYHQGLNVSQALEAASKETWLPEAQAFFEFVAQSSKRGICRLRSLRGRELGEKALD